MKKSTLVIIVLAAVAALWIFRSYNSMVEKREAVSTSWASVETQYQRRADLIPNLVNTVKGYADFEQETLTKVIEARAKATQTTIDPSNMTTEQLQQFQANQGELSGALSRLLVTIERYPELKANQNFLELQAQLEGTENRISVARNNFNEVAQGYNTYIKKLPQALIAGMLGFDAKPYFEGKEGSEDAPVVEF